MSDVLDQGAKKRAQESADLQERQLAEQTKKEKLKSAEAKSDTERRKVAAKSGRSLLVKTGETGLSKTLG